MRTVALETPRTAHLFRDGRTWDARPVSAELQPGSRAAGDRVAAGARRPARGCCRSCFEAAVAGQGGLALIEGPPGVGKSALLERAARHGARARRRRPAGARARAGARVRMGRRAVAAGAASLGDGSRRAAGRPGGAGARAVRRGRGRRGADCSEAGFAILHALYWLVARLAEREPLLLVVDDAHWADEPSLRFLVYLAGRLSDQPIAVLVGARAGELGEGELLRQLAGEPAAQDLRVAVARRDGGGRARAPSSAACGRRVLPPLSSS